MNLRCLLVSSDEKTVRVLRRVLSDLEIVMEHCAAAEPAIQKITRNRFEAIIVDCNDHLESASVLRATQVSPGNKRALGIALVDASLGLRGGFDIGAHFVLHKPLSAERARSSFRAVRAMMKRERRVQARIPIEIAVTCNAFGSTQGYQAKTIDFCEGGMAVQFSDRIPRDNSLHFSLELPGLEEKLVLDGEVAWEGNRSQAGVRFMHITDAQRSAMRQWLNNQLPEPEQDDPPMSCRLSDLSLGGCYLETSSPFPIRTRVILSMKLNGRDLRTEGIVRLMHPEFGMGIQFIQNTQQQQEQVHQMIETLRALGQSPAELQVEPDGMETDPEENIQGVAPVVGLDDALLDLFRHKAQVPLDIFLQEMRQQRHMAASQ